MLCQILLLSTPQRLMRIMGVGLVTLSSLCVVFAASADQISISDQNQVFILPSPGPFEESKKLKRVMVKLKSSDDIQSTVITQGDMIATESLPSSAKDLNQIRAEVSRNQQLFLKSLIKVDPSAIDKVKVEYLYTNAVVMEVNDTLLKAIEEDPYVSSVMPDRIESSLLRQSVSQTGAKTVWRKGYTGRGQTVAVIDTGVDRTHPDLEGKVVAEACFSTNLDYYNATTVCPNGLEQQFGEGSAAPCEGMIDCYHGTHVAGTVAANGSRLKGVAPDADLIAIQVFSRFENYSTCGGNQACARTFVSNQISALEHVLLLHQAGMKIAAVNMSLGGALYQATCDEYEPARTEVIARLREAGIATIVAAGNNGYSNAIAAPACISNAVSVGAICDANNVTDIPTYSMLCTEGKYGVASFSNSAVFLDLLAPGILIESTVPGGGTRPAGGTSQAAPHIAAAWAIIKSARPEASIKQILAALKTTGKPVLDERNGIITPRIRLNTLLLNNMDLLDPIAVELNDFSVTSTTENHLFEWTTDTEKDSDGMNIWCTPYRSGQFYKPLFKINDEMIPSQGSKSTYSYLYEGEFAERTFCVLEDINYEGKCAWHCDKTVALDQEYTPPYDVQKRCERYFKKNYDEFCESSSQMSTDI